MGKYFAKFDLKSIYHQIHDDFKKIYWNDEKGIKTSSAIFSVCPRKDFKKYYRKYNNL